MNDLSLHLKHRYNISSNLLIGAQDEMRWWDSSYISLSNPLSHLISFIFSSSSLSSIYLIFCHLMVGWGGAMRNGRDDLWEKQQSSLHFFPNYEMVRDETINHDMISSHLLHVWGILSFWYFITKILLLLLFDKLSLFLS